MFWTTNEKNSIPPRTPVLLYIQVGFNGVFNIARTCFPLFVFLTSYLVIFRKGALTRCVMANQQKQSNAIDLDHLEVNLIFCLIFRGKNVKYDIFCDSVSGIHIAARLYVVYWIVT